jgi:hypothetical protein
MPEPGRAAPEFLDRHGPAPMHDDNAYDPILWKLFLIPTWRVWIYAFIVNLLFPDTSAEKKEKKSPLPP